MLFLVIITYHVDRQLVACVAVFRGVELRKALGYYHLAFEHCRSPCGELFQTDS